MLSRPVKVPLCRWWSDVGLSPTTPGDSAPVPCSTHESQSTGHTVSAAQTVASASRSLSASLESVVWQSRSEVSQTLRAPTFFERSREEVRAVAHRTLKDRDIHAFDIGGDVEMYAWVLPEESRFLSSDKGRDTLFEWLSNLKPYPREVACCRDARGRSGDSLSLETSCGISRLVAVDLRTSLSRHCPS